MNQSEVDGARDGEREPMGGVADAEEFPLALADAAGSKIGMMEPESFRFGSSVQTCSVSSEEKSHPDTNQPHHLASQYLSWYCDYDHS